jgi:hypothetical protein
VSCGLSDLWLGLVFGGLLGLLVGLGAGLVLGIGLAKEEKELEERICR